MEEWISGLAAALIGAGAVLTGQIFGPSRLDRVRRDRDREQEGRNERRDAIRRLQAIANGLWLEHQIGKSDGRGDRSRAAITELFEVTAALRLGLGPDVDQEFMKKVRRVYNLMHGDSKNPAKWRAVAKALSYLEPVIDNPAQWDLAATQAYDFTQRWLEDRKAKEIEGEQPEQEDGAAGELSTGPDDATDDDAK